MITKKNDTTLIHAGRSKHYTKGAVNPIIQRASSLIFDSLIEKKKATFGCTQGKLFYGRRGTLTHFAFQEAMSQLENGAGCVLYPCGVAAISNSILAFVKSGDNILVSNLVYEPTIIFCTQILSKFNILTTFFDNNIGSNIADLIQINTRVVFLESPASITMEVQDIPTIIKAIRAKSPNVVIIIDNTWAAGILFKALDKGVDISIQSGTKYLSGHSDIMLGTAVVNERCLEQLREHSYSMGQMIDADTAYLAHRGLHTLSVRLRQHEENALKIAEWLSNHPAVARVNHPALPESQGHVFWKRDFTGSNGLFSFILKKHLSQEQLANYLDKFRYFSMAYSWGGYESLIMTSQPEELAYFRPTTTIDFQGTLVRLHIGLEYVNDLINDLAEGFKRINC
ncbi:cystathionine beta-lyase [Candidatus Ishikawella capsulata]|uniref:Cystathionine beta-lyase n=1 Tax=Candidatus Ishikawaella capsulata Mpkobe TaxID=476281 RepID=C5WDK4_9ENTR|nr:cystathionine beta-lyase [Candidatus Ishikawaella capsulata]BAH83410.1 cystathionine beta-lyase [Candidatus Ishikawaella capsulata Mpkobe]